LKIFLRADISSRNSFAGRDAGQQQDSHPWIHSSQSPPHGVFLSVHLWPSSPPRRDPSPRGFPFSPPFLSFLFDFFFRKFLALLGNICLLYGQSLCNKSSSFGDHDDLNKILVSSPLCAAPSGTQYSLLTGGKLNKPPQRF